MKSLLVASTLALFAAASMAQTTPQPDAAPKASLAEKMQKRAQARFQKLDVNGDGVLSRDEVANRPHLAQNFDAIDSNKDGKLTPDELRSSMKSRRSEGKAGTPASKS